jgi:hypothetical protein
MKTLRKTDLAFMERELQVLDYDFTMGIVGGLDSNDCWWRCVASLQSCGSSYSAYDAMALAQTYYGSSFDSNNYAFSGNQTDFNNYIANYVTGSYCSGRILIFDPNQTSNWAGNSGTTHAIVITDYNSQTGVYTYFDPQSGTSGTMSATDVNNSGKYFVNVQ